MDEQNQEYLIAHPENGSFWELLCFLFFSSHQDKFIQCQKPHQHGNAIFNRLVIVIMRLLGAIAGPMARVGIFVEFTLNLFTQNGGFFQLALKLITGKRIEVPKRGSENFISVIGNLDPRSNLLSSKTDLLDELTKFGIGNRNFADFCMMAAKLAYENASVIKNVVTHNWTMHFVEFFDCWNMFLGYKTTQAFMLCDNPENAKLVVVAFRGTEPFDAMDWRTDIDFTWAQIEPLGRVHVGFLEAMGVADRSVKVTNPILYQNESTHNNTEIPAKGNCDTDKPLAYSAISRRLMQILEKNKDAKFILTGHSLGGALAILYPALLLYYKKTELLEKLLAVYTFGQPRIGDKQLANFMNRHMGIPRCRYLRMVYCNDMVPRVPFDDNLFSFKHSGACLYYNSCYTEKTLEEEPNRNFSVLYFIPNRINAAWEIIHSTVLRFTKNGDYTEGLFAMLFRMTGLVFPGISSHSPVNYINAIRLGPFTFPTQVIIIPGIEVTHSCNMTN